MLKKLEPLLIVFLLPLALCLGILAMLFGDQVGSGSMIRYDSCELCEDLGTTCRHCSP